VTGDIDGFTIIDGATPTTVLGMWTTTALFTALDVRPVLGRTFTTAEVEAASPVALISHSLWTQRYGADPPIARHRSVPVRRRRGPDHHHHGVAPDAAETRSVWTRVMTTPGGGGR
jgi:hypothetical protein